MESDDTARGKYGNFEEMQQGRSTGGAEFELFLDTTPSYDRGVAFAGV